MNNMTIKQLAEISGVSVETIRRTGKKLYPLIFQNGKITSFDEEQSIKILETVKKKNFVAPAQNVEVPAQNVEVYNTLINSFSLMTKSFDTLIKLIEKQEQRLTAIENKTLSLQEPKIPKISIRNEIKKYVVSYARKEGIDIALAWTELYEEYEYRRHYSIIRRARHNNMSAIDFAESAGLLEDLLSVAKIMK